MRRWSRNASVPPASVETNVASDRRIAVTGAPRAAARTQPSSGWCLARVHRIRLEREAAPPTRGLGPVRLERAADPYHVHRLYARDGTLGLTSMIWLDGGGGVWMHAPKYGTSRNLRQPCLVFLERYDIAGDADRAPSIAGFVGALLQSSRTLRSMSTARGSASLRPRRALHLGHLAVWVPSGGASSYQRVSLQTVGAAGTTHRPRDRARSRAGLAGSDQCRCSKEQTPRSGAAKHHDRAHLHVRGDNPSASDRR